MKSLKSTKDNINVTYKSDFLSKELSDEYYNILESNLVYNSAEESKVTVFGKQYLIPRKQVAYGESGTFYTFAGVTVNAIDWNIDNDTTNAIQTIKQKVEEFTNETFNFVLINRYANGTEYIGKHRDDEKDLDKKSVIVGVSLGAPRDVVFAPYRFIPEETSKRSTINLAHGSVFVMYYPTNEHWTHEIPKRAGVSKPRVSLTFRKMVIKNQ